MKSLLGRWGSKAKICFFWLEGIRRTKGSRYKKDIQLRWVSPSEIPEQKVFQMSEGATEAEATFSPPPVWDSLRTTCSVLWSGARRFWRLDYCTQGWPPPHSWVTLGSFQSWGASVSSLFPLRGMLKVPEPLCACHASEPRCAHHRDCLMDPV